MKVVVPASRDVRGVLDRADGGEGDPGGPHCVVACPPHPRHGGSRSDSRLRAVADALAERGVDCLRFDYGAWDEGRGETADARAALRWAGERYDRVALAGYSFGGAVALLAAADGGVAACATLAPAPEIDGRDAVAALDDLACPVQVVYGERDDTVDAARVADRVRALAEVGPDAGHEVRSFATDHFFVGFRERAGEAVAAFLADG